MKMKVSELKPGYRLLEAVQGKSSRPLVPRDTILTKEIIDVLNAFFITEVEAEPAVEKGKKSRWKPSSVQKEEASGGEKEKFIREEQKNQFLTSYRNTIEMYKNQFSRWQAGVPVDISMIRRYMFPLFKKIEENPLHLLFLQNQVQKNDYVFHHAVTVGLLSGYIAKRMKLSRGDYYQVLLAGTMADCGMAKVDPKVFQKEQLTSAEREDIQLHPQYSFKLVQNIPSLNQGAKIAILQHHERLDGSGYPSGAKGDSIHLYSRIIAISDVYHAIVCDRVYRNRVSPFEALEIMNRDMFGKLDISILETFTNYLCQQALNMYVKLSNGMVVKIIYIDKRYPTRPVVKEAESGEILRLDQRQDLTIEEIIREG